MNAHRCLIVSITLKEGKVPPKDGGRKKSELTFSQGGGRLFEQLLQNIISSCDIIMIEETWVFYRICSRTVAVYLVRTSFQMQTCDTINNDKSSTVEGWLHARYNSLMFKVRDMYGRCFAVVLQM